MLVGRIDDRDAVFFRQRPHELSILVDVHLDSGHAAAHPAHAFQNGPGGLDVPRQLHDAFRGQAVVQAAPPEPLSPLVPGGGLRLDGRSQELLRALGSPLLRLECELRLLYAPVRLVPRGQRAGSGLELRLHVVQDIGCGQTSQVEGPRGLYQKILGLSQVGLSLAHPASDRGRQRTFGWGGCAAAAGEQVRRRAQQYHPSDGAEQQ